MNERGKMRVLVVTRNLPPLWGGMEQLNLHMIQELAKSSVVCVVGPAGSSEGIAPSVEVLEVPLRPLSWFLVCALFKTLKLALRWQPDVVLAGSGLTGPIAWLGAWVSGARSAAYVHGLDVAVPNRLYRYLWLPALGRIDRVIANSRATAELALRAGLDLSKIKIVNPGVSMPSRLTDESDRARLRSEKKWDRRPLLLSVGRLTSRKGLREFVTEVLPNIAFQYPDVLLLIVGDVPVNSLHAEVQTIESIQAVAVQAGVDRNIEFMGVIRDRAQLARIYQAADLHVFPIRDIPNDPEGFGMVAIEAASYGLATVAYATGGVVDAVADGVSGYLLPPGDGAAFAKTVARLLDQPLPLEPIRAFAEQFDWARFGKRISMALFNDSPLEVSLQ